MECARAGIGIMDNEARSKMQMYQATNMFTDYIIKNFEPKAVEAEHGFDRTASHSSGSYKCICGQDCSASDNRGESDV